MPLSRPYCIPGVIDEVWSNNFQSILDVGIGFGGYGVLFRQTMDARWGRVKDYEWTATLDGVEIEEGYKNPSWDVYNNIYIGNALAVLPTLVERNKHYQMVFLGDVLEHFTKEDGLAIIESAKKLGDSVYVTTPQTFAGNEAEAERFHNEHEAHKVLVEREDLADFMVVPFANQNLFIWKK